MGQGSERAIVAAAAAAAAIGLLAAPGFARVASLTSNRDNTLYEDAAGSLSNGAGDAFFAGRTAQADVEEVSISKRRGLVRFDLQAGYPSNAIVNSASVTMYSTKAASFSAVFLHRAQADWGEGTSDAGPTGGQGDLATPGDATWLHRFYDTTTWTTAGGDFAATVSATVPSVFVGSFTFATTPQLNADVQGWISNPATNFGWFVLGNEAAGATAKRIASREWGIESQRPMLNIDYSASTWKAAAGGAWSDGGNWDFGVPNAIGAEANFPFAVPGSPAALVAVNVDGPKTIGTLNFESPNGYVLSGSPLTVDRAAGRNAINVTSGGSHQVNAAVHLNRDTVIDVAAGSALNVTGNLTAAAGASITKAGGGAFTASRVKIGGALAVDGGTLAIAPNGTASGMVETTNLSVAAGALLAMNDNDFIVNYGPADPSPEAALRDHVKAIYQGGTSGISYTPGAGDVAIAVAERTEWGFSEFNGVVLDTTTVIGKYTYFGDANLDGKVTSDDYVAVDVGLGTGDSWVQGDFNFSGTVTSDDYVAIDVNLGKGSPNPLAFAELKEEMVALHTEMFGAEYVEKLAYAEANGFGATLVPEPHALGALAAGALAVCRVRRRPRFTASSTVLR